MTRVRAARLSVVAAALLAAAWFALAVVQQRATASATHFLGLRASIPAADAGRAERLLDRAATLNPDRGVDLLRARVRLAAGDEPAAIRTVRAVLADEPDDLVAWLQLALLAERGHPALLREAQAAARRLSPPVGGAAGP